MGGTRYTVEIAQSMRRPLLVVDLLVSRDPSAEIARWLDQVAPQVLNVAGPRESGAPGITDQATKVLYDALRRSSVTGAKLSPPRPAGHARGPFAGSA